MAKAATAEREHSGGEVVTIQTGLSPELEADLAQYAGAGVSERQQDSLLPFYMIAQSNSPQVKRQQADKFIEGLEAGDIFNTATRQFWRGSEGILVMPVWFQKAMVEWILRNDGGGYVETHPIDTPLLRECRMGGPDRRFLLRPNGHQMVDTSYHFVIDPATGDPGVVGMTSTGLACSRMWQTIMKGIKIPNGHGSLVIAPSFSRVYRLTTAWKKNEQGDWFTWQVRDEGWFRRPEHQHGYEQAKRMFLEIQQQGGVVMGRPPSDAYSEEGPDLSADTPI